MDKVECQRWWEVSKVWVSFMKTAKELCRRTLIKDVDKKKRSPMMEEMTSAQSKAEETRREENEGKGQAEKWRSRLGKWKINKQKFRKMVQRTQNMLDKTDLRPIADHMDMFQHVLQRMEPRSRPFDA